MSELERFKLPVGIFIILRQDNKVLLQLRQNCSFSGCWGFVGGHLDGKEQIVSAAIREVKEEIGVDISANDLILKNIYHSNADKEYLQFYFECRKWFGKIENKEPDKCSKLKWFDLDKLPENTFPQLKNIVAKINANVLFDEDKFK